MRFVFFLCIIVLCNFLFALISECFYKKNILENFLISSSHLLGVFFLYRVGLTTCFNIDIDSARYMAGVLIISPFIFNYLFVKLEKNYSSRFHVF